MIKCGFCGFLFKEENGRSSCSGCPMNRMCKKFKCPNCGYEIPAEPWLIKLIKKKWGRKNEQ